MNILLKQRPIYLYLSLLGFMSGMIVFMFPIIFVGYIPKNLHWYSLSVIMLDIFFIISGFTTAFISLKFSSYNYWQLEKPQKKTYLKIVK